MWSLYNWIRDFVSEYAWFWWPSSSSKGNTILLVGLENAGKTTLTGRLTRNCLVQPSPTYHPSSHEMRIGSTNLTVTDIGGHIQARRIWRTYMIPSTRLIFVIDASNRHWLPTARTELINILTDDEFQSMPILILANKIDVPTACGENELRRYLQIEEYLNGDDPRVKLNMCSIAQNEGFADGLKWIVDRKIQSEH